MREIERYLLGEMPEAESAKFEDRFVSDEALFYEIVERENELIEAYARGELVGAERQRFERSLDSHPARREKIGNALVIREFVVGERSENKTITIAERSGFIAGIGELFSFGSPAFQFAAIAAIVLLSFATIFLLLENRSLRSVQTELAAARVREAGLTAEIENAQEASGDLTDELNTERLQIAELENEIAKLRKNVPDNTTSTVSPVTIATLVLGPTMSRGSVPMPAKRLDLGAGVTRVSIVITLPAEISERVSVRLNGETIADKVRISIRNAEKTVSVIVPTARIKDHRNIIEIIDATGKPAGEYLFSASRR